MKKRADILMVEQGLAESRARARMEIEAGNVLAGSMPITRPSQKVEESQKLTLKARAVPWVSRAALKLLHGLDVFNLSLEGKTVLDLGASTGGFTEVALAKGAAHVFAVDVGRDQFHPSLRADPRITLMEGTNARDLSADLITAPLDVIVTDVSFISLTLALPPALDLAVPDAQLIALIKPQFEVGREGLGRGGIVKDEETRLAAVTKIADWLADYPGWRVLNWVESPVTGGDGNTEFLIAAEKTKVSA